MFERKTSVVQTLVRGFTVLFLLRALTKICFLIFLNFQTRQESTSKKQVFVTNKPSVCAACGKTVYALEQVIVNENMYHKVTQTSHIRLPELDFQDISSNLYTLTVFCRPRM
jgi:hypothetical protein